MASTIPTHHFSSDREPIGLERIVKRKNAVHNEVHRHDFYEIFFFDSGTGDHMIDLELYPFNAPCCHIVAPGQVHKLSRNAGSSGMVVMFASDLDLGLAESNRELLFRPRQHPCLDLNKQQIELAHSLLKNLGSDLSERIIALNYLSILITKCLQWFGGNKNTIGNKDIAAQFQELVDKRFTALKRVSEYAEKLHISAGHLNDLTKRKIGKSASAVIRDRVMLEAKRLLLHSTYSIKEISYTLGFQDPAYFTRLFKKTTGKSPQNYRVHIREMYK